MNVSFFVHFKNIWTVFNNNKFFEIFGEDLSHCISTHIDHCNVLQMHFVMHFENRIFLFFVFKQACRCPLVTNNKIVIVNGYNCMYCVIIFCNLG